MTHSIEHVGLIVIFGIVLVPVYAMLIGWFFGKPRDFRTVGIGLGYLLGFIIALLVGVAVLGLVIELIIAI